MNDTNYIIANYTVDTLSNIVVVSQHEYNNMFIANLMGMSLIFFYILFCLYFYLDRNQTFKQIKDNNILIVNGLFPFTFLLLNAMLTMLSVFILKTVLIVIPFLCIMMASLIKFVYIIQYVEFRKLKMW